MKSLSHKIMIIYTRNNKKIFLKESDIKNIIMNSVNNLLTEASFYRRKKQDPVYFSMDDELKLSEDPLARVEKEKQSGNASLCNGQYCNFNGYGRHRLPYILLGNLFQRDICSNACCSFL